MVDDIRRHTAEYIFVYFYQILLKKSHFKHHQHQDEPEFLSTKVLALIPKL